MALQRGRLIAAALCLGLWPARAHAADALPEAASVRYGRPRLLCRLKNKAVRESSGIACSRRRNDVLWTHNDSGGGPKLYAFNRDGDDLATYEIAGARVRDCEDLCSFVIGKTPFLLLADVGDNNATRKLCTLYIVEEPVIPEVTPARGKLKLHRTIRFRYPDGARDCESVAVDPTSGLVLLADKPRGLRCRVYALALKDKQQVLQARRIAALTFVVPTGMDVSPDGRRCVLSTYGPACEFSRPAGQNWAAAFRRKPRQIDMPRRRQGEAVAYGPDGKTLYVTSEGAPCPVWEIP
ncbi:MAG: hypothetical protein ACOC8E_07935, partial [Planctomycetota bacterium]